MRNILDYIEQVKNMYEDTGSMAQGPRIGFKEGNGVYDEKDLLGKRVRELMDEGYEFGEAVRQAMKEGYADGGRVPFSYAGIVKEGPNTGKHKYLGFYTKKQAKDLGRGTATAEWFKTKKAMNEALEKRKETTGRGLTEAELTKKHKKELTKRGYKTWGEAPDKVKRSITVATSAGPYESQAKWKEEGLKTKLGEKTRELFKKNPPINPKTGLPYTLQEYTALTPGQKTKLLNRLKGKVAPRPWAKRQGWYPEKKANKLMTYLKHAAKKQESLPLKERNFISVWEGEKFVGVKDKRKNTLWTHVDYDLSKSGAKKGTVITKHPGHKNVQFFLKQAEKFKHGTPDKLLGSYFSKYQRVPKYSEIYQFFNVDPQSVGAKTGKAYKFNPLQQHHQELIGKEPAKSIQLTLQKQNTEASRILNQFEKGKYSFAEADKKLKELGVRIKSSKGWMGPKRQEISAAKSIEAAQAETIKMFKEAYKNNPKIVDQMTKALNIAKKAKGPARLKAIQYLVALGIPVTTLGFTPNEVKAAEAQAAEPGAAADYTKWMFDSGLSPVDKLKVGATGVAGDVLVNKARISKSLAKGAWKWLPLTWTPAGEVVLHKFFSEKEPELADFAEGLKEAGYDINSEEFKSQWNSIPKDERKEMLYEWADMTMDKRSMGEKVLEKAESPWTHAQYAFWKHGVESMQKLLAANPGDSVLKNKLKQHALLGIRMGIPMQVLKTISPIGWTLTAGTVGYKMKNWADENLQWKPLTEQQQTDIQERKTAVPRMLDTYEQASKLAKDQGISYDEALKQLNKPNVPGINFIDFSLPKPVETLAGGGMVGIRKPHAIPPKRGGLRSIMINVNDD